MSALHWLLAPFIAFASLLSSSPHARMIDRVQSSVVRVTGEKTGESPYLVCSGEVIAVHRILTAAHCVSNNMLVDDRAVRILKVDTYYDLALLEVYTNKPVLPLRTADVQRFEYLFALGYAFGTNRIYVLDVRVLLLNITPLRSEEQNERAPEIIVQPGYIVGMSGGPVVDLSGKMVGIVQQASPGVGYGVGALTIQAFLLGTD